MRRERPRQGSGSRLRVGQRLREPHHRCLAMSSRVHAIVGIPACDTTARQGSSWSIDGSRSVTIVNLPNFVRRSGSIGGSDERAAAPPAHGGDHPTRPRPLSRSPARSPPSGSQDRPQPPAARRNRWSPQVVRGLQVGSARSGRARRRVAPGGVARAPPAGSPRPCARPACAGCERIRPRRRADSAAGCRTHGRQGREGVGAPCIWSLASRCGEAMLCGDRRPPVPARGGWRPWPLWQPPRESPGTIAAVTRDRTVA
jgi:hypothetical protein